MSATDEFGGVAVETAKDEFGGVPVDAAPAFDPAKFELSGYDKFARQSLDLYGTVAPEKIGEWDLPRALARDLPAGLAKVGHAVMTPIEAAGAQVFPLVRAATSGDVPPSDYKPAPIEPGKPMLQFDTFGPAETSVLPEWAQGAAGVYNSIANAVGSLTTPGNALIAPFGGLPGAGKVVGGAFLANTIASEPAAIQNAWQIYQDPNASTADKAEAIANASVINPAFAAMLHAGLTAERTGRGVSVKEPVNADGSPDADAQLRAEILKAREEGPSPEFRVLFGGIDPELAGTTPEAVSAYAAKLGRTYRPVPKAAPDEFGGQPVETPNPKPETRNPETPPSTSQPEVVPAQPVANGDVKGGSATGENAGTVNLPGLVALTHDTPVETFDDAWHAAQDEGSKVERAIQPQLDELSKQIKATRDKEKKAALKAQGDALVATVNAGHQQVGQYIKQLSATYDPHIVAAAQAQGITDADTISDVREDFWRSVTEDPARAANYKMNFGEVLKNVLANYEPEAAAPTPAARGGDVSSPKQSTAPPVASKPSVAKPVRVARGLRARKVFDSETAINGPDILSWISENMRMMSKTEAKKSRGLEWWQRNQSLYDDAAPLQRPHHNIIYGGKSMPDQVAQAAYDARVLKEPDVTELWGAIHQASQRRAHAFATMRSQEAAIKNEIAEHEDWLKASQEGEERVSAGNLHVGDHFDVEGERVEVTGIDADTGEVTLKDGKRFGVQRLENGASIYVENYEHTPAGEDWLPPEEEPAPLELAKPESVEEQKARLATEEKARADKAAKAKIVEGAAKPLIGSVGDIGQKDLLGGGDLFALRETVKSVSSLYGVTPEQVQKVLDKGEQLPLFGHPAGAADVSGRSAGGNGPVTGRLSPAEQARAALSTLSPEHLGAALAAGGKVSSIIPAKVPSGVPQYNVNGTVIHTAADFVRTLLPLRSPYAESVKVAILNDKDEVVHSEVLSSGTLDSTSIDGRDFLRLAALHGDKGKRILISHNHPSGDPTPSDADWTVTGRLHSLAAAAGFELVDHVITNGNHYYSMTSRALMPLSVPDKAPWEVMSRGALRDISGINHFVELVNSLRQGNPAVAHIIYLNTRGQVTAIERVEPRPGKIWQALWRGIGIEGARNVAIDFGPTVPSADAYSHARAMVRNLSGTQTRIVDFAAHGLLSGAGEGYVNARGEMPFMETHGMGGSTVPKLPRFPGQPEPPASALELREVSPLVQDINRLRGNVAPQTIGPDARYVGNLLRMLTARMANEMLRADEALKAFRKDFDRTPLPKNWQYDPAKPLPRNLAFIDAYENGSQGAMTPVERAAVVEFKKQNDDWINRVHALGTGALQTLYANYFPHLWTEPDKAKEVFAKLLNKRPLEGPKSFLRQRTHQLFIEGLQAGLIPVHDNPVDLWLLKKREVERYIVAHSFINDTKALGLLKFVHSFARRPEGYSTVNDAAFTQWGPPTVTIKEGYDAAIRAATLAMLAKFGVPHERLANIGGKRWGYAAYQPGVPGTERVVSKFAGHDFVLWHEFGHVMDNRFSDLRDHFNFTGNSPAAKQLRDLADLRKARKAYARSAEEKMANIFHAYVHAPDLFQKTAPLVWQGLQAWLAKHPDVKQSLDEIKPSLQLGVGETEQKLGGYVKLGEWMMPDAAARVVNNYLSPGLNPHLWYRSFREVSNLLNGIQLGLSAFHLGFTSLDAAVSRASLAIEDAAHGDIARAMRTAASVPFSPVTNLLLGRKIRAEVLKPGTGTPEIQAITKALESAGGRVGQDRFWRTEFTRRMMRALRAGTASGYISGTLQAPFALFEQTLRPIMDYVVPRQKLGVFADMARREIERLGPNADPALVRERMRLAWDSVDNRMGQLVYDNLFYNRWVKDVALLSFRAYGWQLGKYREGIGAVVDTARAVKAAGTGKRPEVTHRMAYAMTLPLIVGLLGAVATYLMTGRKPKGKDYFMPPTGGKDANGNDARMNFPSYMKDVLSYSKHPVTSFGHSLNPMFSGIFDVLENKDFYDVRIRNPDDPLWKQGSEVAVFAAKQFVPFSVSGAMKMHDNAAPVYQEIAPFFGITPVPARMTMTPAQELAGDLMAQGMGSAPLTQEQFDKSKMIRDAVRGMKTGDAGKTKPFAEAIAAGKLNADATEALITRMKYTPLQFQVFHLGSDDAMKVWRVADTNEQSQLQPMLALKVMNSRTLPMDAKEKYLSELTRTNSR